MLKKVLKANRLPSAGKAIAVIFLLISVNVSCSYEPQSIRFGEQECDHCRMIISDPPFASQMITDKGRRFIFDAIECMAAHALKEPYAPAEPYKFWVPFFDEPENWLEAEAAVFLKTGELPSPMGLHFSAYPDREKAEQFQGDFGGAIFNWDEVINKVNEEWFDGRY